MPDATFYIRVGDTLPVITSILSDSGGVIDLTGCTINLHVGKLGIFSASIIGDPTEGTVSYEWEKNDISAYGMFKAYWTVEYPDKKRSSFPNNNYFYIMVDPE